MNPVKKTFMLAAMSMIVISCAETKPELPAEELYTRNFIKGGSIIGFFSGFQTAGTSFERTETAQS